MVSGERQLARSGVSVSVTQAIAPGADPQSSGKADKPGGRTHLHHEEDGDAETGAEADDRGDDDGDCFLAQSNLRELGGGAGDRGVAAARARRHNAGGAGNGKARRRELLARTRAPSRGQRRSGTRERPSRKLTPVVRDGRSD